MSSDIYLKIDGVEGECTETKHKGWIQVMSYSWGASHPYDPSAVQSGAHAKGRVNIQDFSLMKYADKSSPKLFTLCASGDPAKTAILEICRTTEKGAEPYMQYELKNAVVTSVQQSGSGSGDLPAESLSIAFTKVVSKYVAVDATGANQGNVPFGWDIAENKKI